MAPIALICLSIAHACLSMAHAGLSEIRECWTIHPSAWQDTLEKQGIDSEEAKEKLETEGVQIFFDESLTRASEREKTQELAFPSLLHDYGDVSIYYAPNPRVRNHLWIVLNREIGHIKEVTGKEAVLMQASINKVSEIFQKKFGVPHVNVARYEKPQQGQPLSKWVIELLPPTSFDSFDVLQKIKDNHYAILRKTNPFPAFDCPEIIEKDIAIWKQAFAENPERLTPSKAETENISKEWILTSKNHSEAEKACLDCIYTALQEQNVPIERTVLAEPLPSPLVSTTKKLCAFCECEVISLQQILETDHFRLLCNHKSPINPTKLLIVSKRHVQSSTELSEEEVKDQHELIQFVVQTLEEKKGLKTCSMLTQEGPLVGQTEPHTHMHLLIDFSPLQFHLHHIDYGTRRPRSPAETKSIVQHLQKVFLNGPHTEND